ncbi:MAG: hypothetical protein LBR31_07395 [Desulfovibrio sp.]|jgi:hypothetical protein|nr:hypothetical protein [Desulfovibrio sp.]
MGTLIAASSDLAAELVLNKIMNNQLATSTGKTVTAAGRTMAAKLSSEGYAAGAAAGAVSSGLGYVQAAQSQVTEMVAKLQELQKTFAAATSAADVVAAQTQADTAFNYITSQLLTAKIGGTSGQSLFPGSSGLTINAGMGAQIKILGSDPAATMTTLTGTVTGLSAATDAQTALDALNTAIGELEGYISDYGISYKQLSDRAAVLNDLAAGFDEAAAGQSINATQGASALLSAMLGSTTT